MTQSPTPLLLMVRDVGKSFGAVVGLQGGSFPIFAGEVNARVDENGAGKSTIVKMLTAMHRPESGGREIDGQRQQDVIAIAANDPNLGCPALDTSRRVGIQSWLRLQQVQGLRACL